MSAPGYYDDEVFEAHLQKNKTLKGLMLYICLSYEIQLVARFFITIIVVNILCCGCFCMDEYMGVEYDEYLLSNEYDKYLYRSGRLHDHFMCARAGQA